MGNWGAAQWWSLALTVAGAVATTTAAVWAWRQAKRRGDDLERAGERWEAVHESALEQERAARAEVIPQGLGTEAQRAALAARVAAIRAERDSVADALIPPERVRFWHSNIPSHRIAVALVADEVGTFRRQGVLLLVGLWLGAAGSIIGLLPAGGA